MILCKPITAEGAAADTSAAGAADTSAAEAAGNKAVGAADTGVAGAADSSSAEAAEVEPEHLLHWHRSWNKTPDRQALGFHNCYKT